MRIAIIGSRDYPDWRVVKEYVRTLPRDTVIVSGGARGVDRIAVMEARRQRMMTEVYPAEWDAHGKAAGIIRNKTIVARADKVVAFWDGTSPGTAHTIRLAKAAGKPVTVIGLPATAGLF